MKKIFFLVLVVIVFTSCSEDKFYTEGTLVPSIKPKIGKHYQNPDMEQYLYPIDTINDDRSEVHIWVRSYNQQEIRILKSYMDYYTHLDRLHVLNNTTILARGSDSEGEGVDWFTYGVK